MEQKRCMGCMELYDPEYGVCPHCGYVEGTPADEAVHMPPSSVLEGRYIIGKVLGYGGFGATYIAWDPVLEQKVAIKEYLPSEFSTRMPGIATVTVFGGDRGEQSPYSSVCLYGIFYNQEKGVNMSAITADKFPFKTDKSGKADTRLPLFNLMEIFKILPIV